MLKVFRTKKQHVNTHNQNIRELEKKMHHHGRSLAVYAMQILSIADIKRTIDLLDSGNIILISLNPLKRRNAEKAHEFLKRLIEYTKSVKANVLLIGNGYLAISPPQISINKVKSDENTDINKRLDEKKQS